MSALSSRPERITVHTTVNAPLERVWSRWTEPEHIKEWNAASADWHTTEVHNDLRIGGSFKCRMEAKNGSAGFDFTGTYTEVEPHALIAYRLEDGREVHILFESVSGDQTTVRETFDAEDIHPAEVQRGGWQGILDRFKVHVESGR